MGRPASRIESSFGNVINSDRSKFTVGTYVPNTEAKRLQLRLKRSKRGDYYVKENFRGYFSNKYAFSTNVLAEEFSTQPMISSGSTWNLALKSDGTVWAWGLNEYGVIANGTVKYAQFPTQIKGLKDIVQVNAKSDFGMALDNTGKVWVWGKEYNNEEETDKSHKMDNSNAIFTSKDATPKVISDISDVKEIDGYGNTSIAVKKTEQYGIGRTVK